MFQLRPCCASTISRILKLPLINTMVTTLIPIANSYEIICEDARIAENKEYLLFDAHPPIITLYTPIEVTPMIKRIPMLTSVTCKAISLPNAWMLGPQGITAEVIKETVI